MSQCCIVADGLALATNVGSVKMNCSCTKCIQDEKNKWVFFVFFFILVSYEINSTGRRRKAPYLEQQVE